jgi:hypothetical protein
LFYGLFAFVVLTRVLKSSGGEENADSHCVAESHVLVARRNRLAAGKK